MSPQERASVARAANDLAAQSHARGAPGLSPDATRETLIAWLQWEDGNGAWSDADSRREGMDPITVDVAWHAVARAASADDDRGDCDCECEHNCSCYPSE